MEKKGMIELGKEFGRLVKCSTSPGMKYFGEALHEKANEFLAALKSLGSKKAIELDSLLLERVAILTAHRVCHSGEHDPQNGKLHGACIVCGTDWPCEYAGRPGATGRDLFITLPDPERMKGKHQEGSHEFAEVRMHSVGQISLPRGRKQIQAREVLS